MAQSPSAIMASNKKTLAVVQDSTSTSTSASTIQVGKIAPPSTSAHTINNRLGEEESQPTLRLLNKSSPSPGLKFFSYAVAAAEYPANSSQPKLISTSYTEPAGNEKIIIGSLATAGILILLAVGAGLLHIAKRRKSLRPRRIRYKTSFEDPFAVRTSSAESNRDKDHDSLQFTVRQNPNAQKSDHNKETLEHNEEKKYNDNEHDRDHRRQDQLDHEISKTSKQGGPLTSHPVAQPTKSALPARFASFTLSESGDEDEQYFKPKHQPKHKPTKLTLFSIPTSSEPRTPSIYNEGIDREQVYGRMPAMGSGSLTSRSESDSESHRELDDGDLEDAHHASKEEKIATMSPSTPKHRFSPPPKSILKKSPEPSPETSPVYTNDTMMDGKADSAETTRTPTEGMRPASPVSPTPPRRRSALKRVVQRVLSPGKKDEKDYGNGKGSELTVKRPALPESMSEQKVETVRPKVHRKSVSFGDVVVRRVGGNTEEENEDWETVDSEDSG